MYSGIGIIPGTDTGGGSEGGENGTHTNQGGTNQGGQTNQGSNTNTGTGDNSSGNATVKPINTQNQNPGGGTLVGGKTDEDPLIYVVSGEEIAASFYQSDVTIQIYTNDRTKKIKYILTTTVPEISNELYPSGLVRELDIENGGTLTFTKNGEYTITAYAYDTAGNKSNPTIMWLKREIGGSTTGGITVSIASGNEGANKWYTSNVTLRVLSTDTGSKKVKYRVRGTATSTGQIGDVEVTGVGAFDSDEVEITNGTTFRIVADGTYSITAYSYDAGGMRLSSSEVLTLKKDATRPTIKSYTGEQIPGQGFKVKVQAEDTGSKLTSNAYTYRHKESTSLADYTSEVSKDAEKLYTGLNQQKTYDMYVMVTDEAGNVAITDVIAKPSLWISNNITVGETVSNGVEGARKYSRSDTIELKFRGQDSNNVDIMKTTYQVLGTVDKEGSIAGNSVTVGQQLSDEYAINDKETRTIALQADGNWTVKVHNYNKEGKLVTTNIVEVTRDITVPTITNIAKKITTTSWTATVTNNDFGASGQATGGGYTYYVNNTNEGSKTANTHGHTVNWTTKPNLSSIKVVTKDKAGNTSEKTVSITYTAKDFAYTGSAQSYTIPKTGACILEVWGAQGGSGSYDGKNGVGGKGGYSVGVFSINNSHVIFAMVGEQGKISSNGSFNGGGGSYNGQGGGGGGTDFRIIENDLNHRVVVAGGGGGFGFGKDGNYGGGLAGGGVGGKQTSGGGDGGFGYGGPQTGKPSLIFGGGGGGWFGGGATTGAGGGSGYVLTASSNKPTGYKLGSEYYLSNAQTIAGNQSFPAPGGGNETGHSGNGYARITLVE